MGFYSGITKGITALVGILSPSSALRYAEHHRALASMLGYGGADRSGANARWMPRDGNINIRNAKDRKMLQARARQLADDNPHVSGALLRIIQNVIRGGIKPQSQIMRGGKLHTAANDAVEADFCAWEQKTQFYDFQALALRHLWTDGGCIAHWFVRPDYAKEGIVPLGIEMLDIDALDESVTGTLSNGNRAFHGVEINVYGDIVALHIQNVDIFSGFSAHLGETRRIETTHCTLIMRQDRIGQVLPVSWMHAVIQTMHNLGEYQQSEQIAARLQAAFGVFVVLPPEQFEGNMPNGSPIQPALTGGVDTLGRLVNGEEFIGQGRMDVLPAGADIKTAKVDRPGNNYAPYVKSTTRGVSAAFGMSHEAFSNDYSEASYSSVRQAVLEERITYVEMQKLIIKKLCIPVFKAWAQARMLLRGGTCPIAVRWQKPAWGWVDPVKDANAAKTKLEMGVITRRIICEEMGYDFDEIERQRQQEKDLDNEQETEKKEPESADSTNAAGRADSAVKSEQPEQ